MSRTIGVLLLASVLGVGGSVGGSVPAALLAPANAVGETCRGLPATIVGAPGERVEGTTGPDVIVSNGARSVDAGDGDDAICTTNTAPDAVTTAVYVTAGLGTDVVDRSGDPDPGAGSFAYLDTGDEFVGSAAPDEIWDQNPTTGRIATGAGSDSIRLYGREADPHVELDGGDGIDSLSLESHLHGLWTIDFRTGARPTATRTVTGAGLESFGAGSGSLRQINAAKEQYRFFGGPADEHVGLPAPQIRSIRTGGGDDRVGVGVAGRFSSFGRHPLIHGGAGTDVVGTSGWTRDAVVIDLAADLLRIDFDRVGPSRFRIPGFENVDAQADSARISGDDGPNVLYTNACPEVMHGRGGDDVLAFYGFVKFTRTCETPGQRFEMYGDAGDDQLFGSWLGDDLLVGGAGVDTANGREGVDRCSAETTTDCEAAG